MATRTSHRALVQPDFADGCISGRRARSEAGTTKTAAAFIFACMRVPMDAMRITCAAALAQSIRAVVNAVCRHELRSCFDSDARGHGAVRADSTVRPPT